MEELPAERSADRLLFAKVDDQLGHRRENAGIPANQASCVTCHNLSSVKSDGTDGITLLRALPTRPVGLPQPLPSSDWILRDFVWSLSLACPNSLIQTCAP
jgi:hypothetical protein